MGKKLTKVSEDSYDILPVIALENVVITPVIAQPVKIDSDIHKEYIDKCYSIHTEVFFGTILEPSVDPSSPNEIQPIGVVCHIDRILQMPGAPSLAFVKPVCRAKLIQILSDDEMPVVKVQKLKNIEPPKKISKELICTTEKIDFLADSFNNFLAEPEKESTRRLVNENSDNIVSHLYALMQVSPLSIVEKLEVLNCNSFKELADTLAILFDEAEQRLKIQAAVHERTHRELTQQQKENFLRIHLQQIKHELGEDTETEDIDRLVKTASSKNWNKQAKTHFENEIRKLKRLNINNPEYSVQYSYLENLLNLPWNKYKKTKISLDKAREILDRDHFGLDKVKERIIEYLAVLKLRDDLKAPILCLYGPPGVGKTSIGKSIAEATEREYARIALGGMHDESEIRGHRRTYIGAMPGRFIHTLSKLTYGNPLILLDEIDKVGKDYKGDPSSALLEALDPEQNNTFHDNFIDFPYDLSKVLFIATANDLSTIPSPLRDRMEIIEMTGYIPEEKREIALNHLVDKSLKNNGFKEGEVKFTPEALDLIIRYYTREAGVRQLEKKIGSIIRKIALLKASDKKFTKKITPELAEKFLGKREVLPRNYENNDFAGIANGLAWTPAGGDILQIETSLSPGKGEKVTLTGNLGDVMKESAVIALQYLKSHAGLLGIDPKVFNGYDVHIHVPEGAVPKDGPSAGITLASSMLSAFTGRKMQPFTAMTGEITLRGKVLPVGGVKEKIIAAREGGINHIILSEENRKDIEEIPSRYIKGMNFIYVKNLPEVFENALTDTLAPDRFLL